MKVILLKDVAKVGRRHEVKELADGFARNFIIAKGLGVVADERNLSKLKQELSREEGERKIQNELLKQLLSDLEARTVVLSVKANKQGHLFASLHREDISRALKEQYRLEVPPSMIVLPEPLKVTGIHQVEMKTADLVGRIRVEVLARAS